MLSVKGTLLPNGEFPGPQEKGPRRKGCGVNGAYPGQGLLEPVAGKGPGPGRNRLSPLGGRPIFTPIFHGNAIETSGSATRRKEVGTCPG